MIIVYKMLSLAVALSLVLVAVLSNTTPAEENQLELTVNHVSFVALDVDGDGKLDALTDGLLLLRGMFGLTGDSLINGAVSANVVYTSSSYIQYRISLF